MARRPRTTETWRYPDRDLHKRLEPDAREHCEARPCPCACPCAHPPVCPPAARAQVGSILRDRFLLQEKISGGSMGVVYKALDRRLADNVVHLLLARVQPEDCRQPPFWAVKRPVRPYK